MTCSRYVRLRTLGTSLVVGDVVVVIVVVVVGNVVVVVVDVVDVVGGCVCVVVVGVVVGVVSICPVAFLKQTAPRTSERSELHEMYAASIVSFFKRRHFSGVRFPRGMERKFGSLFQFQAYPRMVLDPIHTPVQVAFGDWNMPVKVSRMNASCISSIAGARVPPSAVHRESESMKFQRLLDLGLVVSQ